MWILAGELIYMFRKDTKFRNKVQNAEWIDKLKEIANGLIDFNKWVFNDLQASTANLWENETVVNLKEKFSEEYETIKTEIDKLSTKVKEYKDNPEVQKVIDSTESKLIDRKNTIVSKYNELNEEYHFDEKIDKLIAKLEKTKKDLAS